MNWVVDFIAYNPLLQFLVSPAGYWRAADVIGQEFYKAFCWYLPKVNNEVNHSEKYVYKMRMMQLNRLMLAQYTNDSMVDPY